MGRKPEGKAEKLLKKFGKKVDDFISELKEAKEGAGQEFNQRFDELKQNKDSLSEQFNAFKENHQDKWDEVQSELDRAAQELKKAFNSVFASRKAASK